MSFDYFIALSSLSRCVFPACEDEVDERGDDSQSDVQQDQTCGRTVGKKNEKMKCGVELRITHRVPKRTEAHLSRGTKEEWLDHPDQNKNGTRSYDVGTDSPVDVAAKEEQHVNLLDW